MGVIKLASPDPGEFDETTSWTVMCCGNIEVNSNKFYAIEIQRNRITGEHRIFTHYGRVNGSNVYEARGPYFSFENAKHEYDKIIKAKQRGKTGGTSKYEIVDVITPTVGSNNIRGKTSKTLKVDNTREIVSKSSHKFEPDVMRLLNQFADENIHKITSSTSISFTSQGLETALGPVTEAHVQKARSELQSIQTIVKRSAGKVTSAKRDFVDANNRYLSLVPHTFGRKITESDWIADDSKLIEEFDLLDQLEAAVKLGLKQDSPQQFAGLETDVKPVDMKPFYDIVEKTKAHSHLRAWKVKNAYEVEIPKERQRFNKAEKKYGNLMDFFHGSGNCNLLSILLGGLIIPPYGANFTIAGRMFGNGVYGASSSTKSLNYSLGSWTGRRNKYDNAFLLRVKFAMGEIYEPTRAMAPPPGYNSTAAYARKTGLQNDEFIVYALEQCSITHLLELTQK
jgi:predicted DNA-binding WGR domain protein